MNFNKEERKQLLLLPFKDRLNITKEVIKDTLNKAKYPVIQFSGGIDSCFMAYLIHKIDPTVPAVFNDWGLFFPEQEEFCIKFFKHYNFKYYISRSNWDYKKFFKKYGFPIFKGIRHFISSKDYSKYNITTKCRMLKHSAWKNFLKEHKCDYYFVGILADENPQRKALFIGYGFYTKKKNEPTRVKPIVLIKKDEIFKYCKKHNILYPKDFYKDTYKGITYHYKHCDLGCFICTPRFNKEGFGRLGRNTRKNPKIIKEVLDMGLRQSFKKIIADYPEESWFIKQYLEEYDTIKYPKTAYDLDGVLCPLLEREKKYFEQNKAERELHESKKIEHFKTAKLLIRPLEKDFYIISARRNKYRDITERWLKDKRLNYKELILMEGTLTFGNIIDFKYKALKDNNIERYYEDDPKIIQYLKKKLPKIEFILVHRSEKSVIKSSQINVKRNVLTFL